MNLTQRIKKGKVGFYPGKIKVIVAPLGHEKAIKVLEELESPSQNIHRRIHCRRFQGWKSRGKNTPIRKECSGEIRGKEVELMVVDDPLQVIHETNLKMDEVLVLLSKGVKGAGCFSMNPDAVFTTGSAYMGKIKESFCWVMGVFTNSSLTIRNAADQLAYNYFDETSQNPRLPWRN